MNDLLVRMYWTRTFAVVPSLAGLLVGTGAAWGIRHHWLLLLLIPGLLLLTLWIAATLASRDQR